MTNFPKSDKHIILLKNQYLQKILAFLLHYAYFFNSHPVLNPSLVIASLRFMSLVRIFKISYVGMTKISSFNQIISV